MRGDDGSGAADVFSEDMNVVEYRVLVTKDWAVTISVSRKGNC